MLISSSMTAVGGVFYGFYYRNLFPSQVFDIGRSIELILAPIIGGLGTVFGPIVGAIILTPLGEVLTALMQRLGINAPGAKAIFYGVDIDGRSSRCSPTAYGRGWRAVWASTGRRK